MTGGTDTNGTEWTVYPGVKEGDVVRWEDWSPGRGRQSKVGEIAEIDENPPMNAFPVCRIEFDGGRARVPSNKITDVVDECNVHTGMERGEGQ